MDHYLEIRLLPDPEFTPTLLMNALYAKLHRALVAAKSRDIGISFPEVEGEGAGLGGRLRLHGEAEPLRRLMATAWLRGMGDHTHVGEPSPVPARAQHRVVRRVQAKSNPERLRRRLMKRKGISESQAREAIPDSAVQRLDLPFVTLTSSSTGQTFRLFIEHRPPEGSATPGEFSGYGLSPTATVPWF